MVVEAGAEDGAADRGTAGAGAVAVGDLTAVLAGVKLALVVCFSVCHEAAARRGTREAVGPSTVPGAGAVAGADLTAPSAGDLISPVVGELVTVAERAEAEAEAVAGAGEGMRMGRLREQERVHPLGSEFESAEVRGGSFFEQILHGLIELPPNCFIA